jgi:hypothetical protein
MTNDREDILANQEKTGITNADCAGISMICRPQSPLVPASPRATGPLVFDYLAI